MWIYVVLGIGSVFCVGIESGSFSDLSLWTGGTFLGACVLSPGKQTGTAFAPYVGSGCGCDPFGAPLHLTRPRKRLCNSFREGREWTALVPPMGKRRNDSRWFRLLKKRGCAKPAQSHPAGS